MATQKQALGDFGEKLVAKSISCPGCKRGERTMRQLPPNFKCADLVCDFCGYLSQVKSKSVSDVSRLPSQILGAAWAPQQQRMESGIYFSLYIVLVNSAGESAIYFLPRELQTTEMFEPRTPLSSDAKRAGWQGFYINLNKAMGAPIRLK